MAISNYYTGLQGMDLGSLGSYSPYGNYGLSGMDLSSLYDYTGNTGTGSNWLSGLGGGLSGLANLGLAGLQGYTGLQSIGLAKKQLGLANKDLTFQKALANRNLANQAQTINTAYNAAGQAAIGLLGGIDARTGQTITPDAETLRKAEESIKSSYVSGSPI